MTQLSEAQKDRRDVLHALDVIVDVCAQAGIEHRDLIGPSQVRRVSHPRQFSMWRCWNETGLSQERIGRMHGGRDPSTVRHACEAVEQRLAENKGRAEGGQG